MTLFIWINDDYFFFMNILFIFFNVVIFDLFLLIKYKAAHIFILLYVFIFQTIITIPSLYLSFIFLALFFWLFWWWCYHYHYYLDLLHHCFYFFCFIFLDNFLHEMILLFYFIFLLYYQPNRIMNWICSTLIHTHNNNYVRKYLFFLKLYI